MSEDISEKIASLFDKANETTDRGQEISDQISKLFVGEIGPTIGLALTMATANFIARSELTSDNGRNCLDLFLMGVKLMSEARLATIKQIKNDPVELKKFVRIIGLDTTTQH
jgi:hypothetical protein